MKDEPGRKYKSFAAPEQNVRIGSAHNEVVPGADEIVGADQTQGSAETSTVAADHPSPPAIADGDDVVAPYVPSSDGVAADKIVAPYVPSSPAPLPAGQKPSQSELSQSNRANFIESVAKRFVHNPRTNFFRLALAITVVMVVCLFIQRSIDQASLDHHSELAQVYEYAKRTYAAALEWTEAIAVAKRMQLPPKAIADLDMRAQKAWQDAWEEMFMEYYRKKITDARQAEISRDIDVHRRAELHEAVALYARVENCQASEIRALWALEKMLDGSGVWYQPEMDKPHPLNSGVRAKGRSETELLNDYCQENPELSELVKGQMNPYHAVAKLAQMQLTEKEARTLIPEMHEHVYTSSGLEPFLQAQQQLDRVLQEAGYDPLSFEDRLKLAKSAVTGKDDAAAVVEYVRCLGLKEDDQTRREFLHLCGGMFKEGKEYDEVVRQREEALTVLDKLHTLEAKCFGADSDQTLITLMARARILRSLGRFDEAEKTLDELLAVQKSVPTIQAEKGVMLAAAGKFDQAAMLLRQSVGANEQHSHMLETLANIESATGHFSQAQQALDELKTLGSMTTPDTFGILKPDQFDSTTVE